MNFGRFSPVGIAGTVSVLLLMGVGQALCQGNSNSSANEKPASSKPVPRLADGHPDLSGLWGERAGQDTVTVKKGDHLEILANEHRPPHRITAQKRKAEPPPYKPELLAKVQQLDEQENKLDPIVHCKPAGFVRVGAPVEIVAIPGRVVFFYEQENDNFYRIIPTDGRPHDPDADPSYNGDAVGHWEGDTLVVDTVNFNDDTWLGLDGWFHSTDMHVTERFSRDADGLHYQATVVDPKVFTKPWVMPAHVSKPSKVELFENAPCVDSEFDLGHLVNHDHL
jgi:hypothetical protein